MEGMKLDPLVSVIIPAYNHEDYIEDCVLSVIGQTYENIEIIIINDGSTDKTEEKILKIIECNDRRIHYVNQDNRGVCKTLNRGLNIATGKYIAFLASDDMWLPNRLERQINFLEKNKHVGFVFADSKFIFNNDTSNLRFSNYKPILNKLFYETNFIKNIYFDLFQENFICAITILIRKEALDKVGGFDVNIDFEDYDMWLRLSKEYEAGYIPEVLALYRMHSNNISNDSILMFKGTIKTIMKQFKQYPLKNKPLKKVIITFKLTYNIIVNRLTKSILKKERMENKDL